jgi:hypothetical protein
VSRSIAATRPNASFLGVAPPPVTHPLLFLRQPLVERGKIDHHALMGAAADLFGLVVRREPEFDSLALDLDDLGVDLVAEGVAAKSRSGLFLNFRNCA